MAKQHYNNSRKVIRWQRWALIVSIILLVVKMIAWWATQSNAILTDALEQIINVATGGFGLYALQLSAIPRDRNHPYGHGKVEFISSGIEGVFIVLAGLFMIGKAIYNYFYPVEITDLSLGIILTIIAGITNGYLGFTLSKKGKHNHSTALYASGRHLLSDAWSSAALVGGLLLIYLNGWMWLDQVLTLFLAAIIIYTGYRVLRKSIGGIMDETNFEKVRNILRVLQSHRKDDWIDLHNLRIIEYGADLHIDCHMTLPWYYTTEESHSKIDEIESFIQKEAGQNIELFIHVDPCTPRSCAICSLHSCPVRRQSFQKRIKWDLDLVMENQKHGLRIDE